jgi:hypothetical protein
MKEQSIRRNGRLRAGKLSCKSFFFRVLSRNLLKIGLFCVAFFPFSGGAVVEPENCDWLRADFAKVSSRRTLDFAEANLMARRAQRTMRRYRRICERRLECNRGFRVPLRVQGKENWNTFPKSGSTPPSRVRYIGNSPSAVGTFIFLSTLCLGSIVLSYYNRRKKKDD